MNMKSIIEDEVLGYYSIAKIIGNGRVKLFLKYAMIRSLVGVLYNLEMAKNLIYMSMMSEASMHTISENEICNMA